MIESIRRNIYSQRPLALYPQILASIYPRGKPNQRERCRVHRHTHFLTQSTLLPSDQSQPPSAQLTLLIYNPSPPVKSEKKRKRSIGKQKFSQALLPPITTTASNSRYCQTVFFARHWWRLEREREKEPRPSIIIQLEDYVIDWTAKKKADKTRQIKRTKPISINQWSLFAFFVSAFSKNNKSYIRVLLTDKIRNNPPTKKRLVEECGSPRLWVKCGQHEKTGRYDIQREIKASGDYDGNSARRSPGKENKKNISFIR